MRHGLRLAFLALVLSSSALSATELPFEPGERVRWKITYLAMHAGDLQMSVGQTVAGEQELWPLEMHARSRGLIDLLHQIDERFVSHFDPVQLRSTGSDLDSKVNGERTQETVRVLGESAQVRRERLGKVTESTREVAPNAHDIVSALYFLRTLELKEGMDVLVPVFTSKKSFDMSVRVIGRQKVKTDAGVFDTWVVRCRTGFSGKFATDRDLRFWVTADERRLPVRAEADFALGSLHVSLKDYRSGGELARR